MSSGVSDNVLLALKDILRKEMNEIADNIAGGSCKNFDDYQHQTGIIYGLAIAERELLDLNKLIEEA